MPGKFLKRKTSRNKIKNPIEKDFDLVKFKDQINKEMSRFKSKSSFTSKNLSTEYDKRLKLYITDFFSLQTLMLINRIFHDSKKLSKHLRNDFSLHSIFTKAIRQLLMNELELIYFSVYLDIFGWRNNNYEVMEYFLITGLNVKKILNDNVNYIEEYLNLHYENFSEKYKNWVNNIKDKKNEINLKIVNEKYSQLKRPYNAYCKNNFIDYNGAVDRILHMSLPYNDNSKHQENKNLNAITEENEDGNKKKKFTISFKVEKPCIQSFNINNAQKTMNSKIEMKNNKNKIINMNNNNNKDINTNLNNKNNNLQNQNYFNNNNNFIYHQLSNNDNTNINNYIQHQNSNLNNLNYSLFNSLNINNFNNQNTFFQNNPKFNNQNEFMKQQSELVYNDSALLFGKSGSDYNQSLFQRNSLIENPFETLQECFFKPIELKQNLSINSYGGGEFKQNENNLFNLNLNKMISNNSNNATKIPKIKSNSSLNNLTSFNPQVKDNLYSNQNNNINNNNLNTNFNVLNINQSNNNDPSINSKNFSLEPPSERKNFLSLYHNLVNKEKK